VNFLKAFIIIVSLIVITSAVLSIAGNVVLYGTFHHILDPLENITDAIGNDLTSLQPYLPILNATGENKHELDLIYLLINESQLGLSIARNYSSSFETDQLIAICVIFIIPVFAGLTGILGSLFIAKIILLAAILGLLALPFTWFTTGILVPLDTLFADACPQAESYINTQASRMNITWVDYYLNCEGKSPLANVTNYANTRLNETEMLLQYAIDNHWNQSLINQIRQYVYDLDNITFILGDLGDCKRTESAWDDFFGYICQDTFNQTLWILVDALVCSVFLLILVCVVCVKRKTLMHRKEIQEGYEPLNEMT